MVVYDVLHPGQCMSKKITVYEILHSKHYGHNGALELLQSANKRIVLFKT